MIFEKDIKQQTVRKIAFDMMVAARTSPKAKGIDTLEIALADKDEIRQIADRMTEIGNRPNTTKSFIRDAKNVLNADTLFLIGTRIKTIGLSYCSLCGFSNCDEKQNHPDHPCAYNTNDLGIAIGSAVSIASDARADNRVMYTVGMAVKELGLLGADVKIIFGIPLSSNSKNIFFDRG